MLPVCRNRPPEVFAQFHMRCARSRACTFCCVMGVRSLPGPSISFAAVISRSNASSMLMTVKRTPSSFAMSSAALRVPSDE